MKKAISFLLSITLFLSLATPALAGSADLPETWGFPAEEEDYALSAEEDAWLEEDGDANDADLFLQEQTDADLQAYLSSLQPFTVTPVNADCSPEEEENTVPAQDAEYAPGVVLFSLREGTAPEALGLSALGLSDWEPILSDGQSVDTEAGTAVWYRAACGGDEAKAVAALRTLDEVTDAELDYIYHSDSYGEPQEVEVGKNWAFNELLKKANQIWWSTELSQMINPGAGTVVAVIDTGVDYTHEDLAANMWVNTREIPGNGIDDDGNGYIDDVYGVNVTAAGAQAGDPMDDNGHGTHVAGIIAMSSNGRGGVGLAWGAQIMAIKAGQSTGTFTSSEIAKAIDYAHAMGADVINMSFGGTEKSYLVEQALASAFADCVLVASAGNDGLPTTDAPDGFIQKEDIYPAGYRYVLGVMATDQSGDLASFSNWDYKNNANCEYELTAPGVGIFSTLPGDRYATWSGTSMAAPCVSAAAAIVRSKYADKDTYSSRFIMGQLASATDRSTVYEDKLGDSHIYAALSIFQSCTRLPEPNIGFSEVFALDSQREDNEINDGDSILDAGETIDLGFALRNQWGQTGEITVTADTLSDAGVVNPYVTFVTDTVTLAPAGTFAASDNGFVREDSELTGVTNPITFTLSKDTPNGAEIRIHLTAATTNGVDSRDGNTYTAEYDYIFRVQNGRGIRGQLKEDTTLTADYYWIIENTLYIPEGITLTVEPGTQIQFWSSDYEDAYGGKTMAAIINSGTLNMIGTEESPISCFPGRGFSNYVVEISGSGVETLKYCEIINPRLGFTGSGNNRKPVDFVDHCGLIQNQSNLYSRRLDGSSVITEYSLTNCYYAFCVQELRYSKIEGFRSWTSGYKNDFPKRVIVKNNVSNCFNNCSIEFEAWSYNFSPVSTANGTVFLRGNGGNDAGSSGMSLTGTTAVSITYNGSEVIQMAPVKSYDGKYYVFLPMSSSMTRDGYFMAKAMAESLNGTLLCLGSEEEEDFVYQMMHDITEDSRPESDTGKINCNVWLGYRYPEGQRYYVWDDGQSYTPKESLKQHGDGYTKLWIESYPSSYNRYFYADWGPSGRDSNSYIGLEIPVTLNGETEQTIDDLRAAMCAFDPDTWLFDYYAPKTTNCAILNPVLNNNPETWARITAESYDSSIRCYNLSGNYWGTERSSLINKMIVDADDYPGTLGDIVEEPILTTRDDLSDIYPFVTDIRVTDQDGHTVKNVSAGGSYTVSVSFNRDMDTTVQPTVTYGPDAPYTDFSVSGEWESPRLWVGKTVISPVMTSGTQYFKTTGGRADDDHWLVCGNDILRFEMNVSTTGAAAMLLQASGGANKVELSWAQNDYETLAGYNIYRAESKDGKYTKINGAIINDTEYTDLDVTPGVTYYYYFTVVNTEGNEESAKSNIAEGRPLDNILPVLQHIPVSSARSGKSVGISATATDNIAVDSVKLYYRISGDEAYRSVTMSKNANKDGYTATIPASVVIKSGVDYYIVALDGDGNAANSGTAEIPNHIAVDDTPFITGSVPSRINVSGGATVTVMGGCFTEGMILKVGSQTVEYTLVDDGQLTFTAPSMPAGSYSIALCRDGVELAHAALTYTDESSLAQIPTSMTLVSNVAYDIPLYFTVRDGMTSFHAELDLGGMKFHDFTVEKTALTESFGLEYKLSGNKLILGGMASDSVAVNGSTPLVYIRLTPSAVSSDQQYSFTLSNVRSNGADVAKLIHGIAIVKPNYSLTATVQYYAGSQPVSGAAILAAGVSGTTDSTGKVTLTGIPSSVVTVLPSMTGTTPNGVVTANDAALVLKASVGKETLSNHQELAADVNSDGRVNEADASLILQMAVRKITNFPGGKVWTFSPASQALTLRDGENTLTFTAILLGDVDGSWNGAGQ